MTIITIPSPSEDSSPDLSSPPPSPRTYRIATFNVENLYARYDFKHQCPNLHKTATTTTPPDSPSDTAEMTPVPENGNGVVKSEENGTSGLVFDRARKFVIHNTVEKHLTSLAVLDMQADVLCLQEVESLQVLDRFNDRFLGGMYPHSILIEGRDARRINIAVMSKYPIANIRTHRHVRSSKNRDIYVFSRDCLEVDVDFRGTICTFFVQHFTSMSRGRKETRHRRWEQSRYVARLIDRRYAAVNYEANFIVLGDFNDTYGGHHDTDSGISRLVCHPQLVDVVHRLDENERWTHHFAPNDEYSQLDYILLSKKLAEKNVGRKPHIMRKGLAKRATRSSEERYSNIGDEYPKASDHCPVYMDIELL